MNKISLNQKSVSLEKILFSHIYKSIYASSSLRVRLKFALAYYLLPIIALLCSCRIIRKKNNTVKVLFITRSKKFSKRFLNLQEELSKRGIISKIKVLNSWDVTKYKFVSLADKKFTFWHHHLSINFILSKYLNTKIFIFSSNNSVFLYLLKEYMLKGQRIVNIAHGVPGVGPTNALIGDDLYYVFGEGSIKNVVANPFKIGSPSIITTGSMMFRLNMDMDCRLFKSKRIVFVSQYSEYQIVQNTMIKRGLKLFLASRKYFDEYEFIYRPHPLEPKSNYSWISDKRIIIEDPKEPLDNTLIDCRIIINNWSNTSIEAGAYGIPSLIVSSYQIQSKNFVDYFPLCLSLEDLVKNIELLNSEEFYNVASKRANAFYRYHINSDNGPFIIADEINTLINGNVFK